MVPIVCDSPALFVSVTINDMSIFSKINKYHTDYTSKVYVEPGREGKTEGNLNLKKMTKQGDFLGSLFSSLELRGYFESIEADEPIRKGKPIPLLTYSFIDYLENHNFSDFHLIEFGSGNSTLYFEKMFKSVTSFETNVDWYKKIKKLIKTTTTYTHIETEKLENGDFSVSMDVSGENIAIIDAGCNRYKIAKHLLEKCKPAFIVLDNSEWYKNTSELISSFNYFEIPFWGYKNTEHWESCTSLFINMDDPKILRKNNLTPPPLARKMTNNMWDNP